nr:MAG TPA: Manganese responsive transcriptional regulator member uptake regulator, fur, mur [Caudoviricetes sp.]
MPVFFVSADEGRIYGVCRKCALPFRANDLVT